MCKQRYALLTSSDSHQIAKYSDLVLKYVSVPRQLNKTLQNNYLQKLKLNQHLHCFYFKLYEYI